MIYNGSWNDITRRKEAETDQKVEEIRKGFSLSLAWFHTSSRIQTVKERIYIVVLII